MRLKYQPQEYIEVTYMTDADVYAHIAQYEKALGMTSDELVERLHEGEVPDTFEAMALRMLLKYRWPEGDLCA